MSLTVWCHSEKKSDSSTRKRTRDLSIKLQVLYLLSYWGICDFPSKQQSPSGDYTYIYVFAPTFRLVTFTPVVEDFLSSVNNKVPLDCLNINVKIDVSDSLVPLGEKI